MGRVDVLGVSIASLPDFVEQECAGRVRGAVQVVAKTAFFFSSGSYQGAQLRFENRFLAFARSQQDNQRDSIFRELRVGAWARASFA